MPRVLQKDGQRIVPSRAAGIPKRSDAPFWRGVRAEDITAQRVADRVALAAAKKLSRRRATSTPDGARVRREKTPSQLLRRLERALGRRKTLAARQRVQAQITSLKARLGVA